MNDYIVMWTETHSVKVKAITKKEAEDKVEDMIISDLKINKTYSVNVSKLKAAKDG